MLRGGAFVDDELDDRRDDAVAWTAGGERLRAALGASQGRGVARGVMVRWLPRRAGDVEGGLLELAQQQLVEEGKV